MDHTSHYEQAVKGRGMPRGRFLQNCPDDVCQEHNRHKHHLYMKQEEDQTPFVDYIVVAMRDSLYDKATYAKVFSSLAMSNKN